MNTPKQAIQRRDLSQAGMPLEARRTENLTKDLSIVNRLAETHRSLDADQKFPKEFLLIAVSGMIFMKIDSQNDVKSTNLGPCWALILVRASQTSSGQIPVYLICP